MLKYDFSQDTGQGVIPYINKIFKSSDKIMNSQEFVLMNGLNCFENPAIKDKYKDVKHRYLFAHWSPCEFAQPYELLKEFEYFTKVFCICPYTCEWANKNYGTDKFVYTYYPFSNYSSSFVEEKEYDVSYFGGIHANEHISGVQKLASFDYRFLSLGPYGPLKDMVTGAVTPDEKLNIISKGKMSLCYNWIQMNPRYWERVNKHLNGQFHGAFNVNNSFNCPQFKVRVHEVASCGSLILARKDIWNVIEDWYEPDKEFVYFENEETLEGTIKEILNNWDHFSTIAKNGHEKQKQYTVENWIGDYINV